MVGALAGLDAAEVEDPRRVAEGIRAGLAGRALGPKVSVVVDGGGALPLDGVAADVRVKALGGGVWEVAGVGRFDAAGAVAAALGALGRGRDRGREAAAPVGRFAVRGGRGGRDGGGLRADGGGGAGGAGGGGRGRGDPAGGGAGADRRRRRGGAARRRRGWGSWWTRAIRGWRSWPARGRRPARRGGWRRGRWRRRWRGRPELLRRGAGASLGVRQAVRAAGGGLRVAGGGGRDRGGRGGGAGGAARVSGGGGRRRRARAGAGQRPARPTHPPAGRPLPSSRAGSGS